MFIVYTVTSRLNLNMFPKKTYNASKLLECFFSYSKVDKHFRYKIYFPQFQRILWKRQLFSVREKYTTHPSQNIHQGFFFFWLTAPWVVQLHPLRTFSTSKKRKPWISLTIQGQNQLEAWNWICHKGNKGHDDISAYLHFSEFLCIPSTKNDFIRSKQ